MKKILLSKREKDVIDRVGLTDPLSTYCRRNHIDSVIVVSKTNSNGITTSSTKDKYGTETTYVNTSKKETKGEDPVKWYKKHVKTNGTETITGEELVLFFEDSGPVTLSSFSETWDGEEYINKKPPKILFKKELEDYGK